MNIEDFRYKSLGAQGYQGADFAFLDSAADFETSQFLRKKDIYTEAIGAPIFHQEIKKLFSVSECQKIISRSNIFDQLHILIRAFPYEKISIPFDLNCTEEIYDYVHEACKGNPSILILEDVWKLNYSRLNIPNLIIISSISKILGISGINYGWLLTSNLKIYNFLTEIINDGEKIQCKFAEIYSLISLRNYHLINSINREILTLNKNFLLKKSLTQNIKISNIHPSAQFFVKNAQELAETLRKKHGFYLSAPNSYYIEINFGQKKFAEEFSLFIEELIRITSDTTPKN